jgi:uncharacterized protein YuzE
MSNKDKFYFSVSVEAHEHTGEVLAVYFQVRQGKTKVTKEYANGDAFADYDRNGKLLGIELLAPCRPKVLDSIAKQPSAKKFLRDAVPRSMLVTS